MDRIDHGTMFYKAVKLGLIDPSRSVQVGIRTNNPDTMGFNIIDAREVHETGPVAVAQKIKAILGDHPTYVTFDIDGLESGLCAGYGHAGLGRFDQCAGGDHAARHRRDQHGRWRCGRGVAAVRHAPAPPR